MIVEEKVNLWRRHIEGEWCCITTNNFVTKGGLAVMGRGCAKQAALRYPKLPAELASSIKLGGGAPTERLYDSRVHVFHEYKLIAFPVKFKWYEPASLELVAQSAQQLMTVFDDLTIVKRVYLPRPGCGNGQLQWEDVKPVLEPILDERVIVVSK